MLEVGQRRADRARAHELRDDESDPTELPRVLGNGLAAFTDFMQQIVSGLASGGIYALLALALVIIHRSTGVINFAQGEMATLSTYIALDADRRTTAGATGPAFVVTLPLVVRRRRRDPPAS